MPQPSNVPPLLKPYLQHGVHLDWGEGSQAKGDCPWCGNDKGKFSVSVDSGLWHCWVCKTGSDKGGGNALTFVKLLWERSLAATRTRDLEELAKARGLLDYQTLTEWGVCRSITNRDWLIPGFDAEGKLHQLYRWVKKGNKRSPIPTPHLWPEGKAHGLLGVNLHDKDCEIVYLHESWGNALTFWEVLRQAKNREGGVLEVTGSVEASLAAKASVLAVPGSSTFHLDWLPLVRGKRVVLMYDSDYPSEKSGKSVEGAGIAGTKRVAAAILGVAGSIEYVKWGEDGYDPDSKSGLDVRDVLSNGEDVEGRVKLLESLLGQVEPVPTSWLPTGAKIRAASHANGNGNREIEPLPCHSWKELISSWSRAARMRTDIEDMLWAMITVVASTMQTGNQLFLQCVADAGSLKTVMCDALLVSKGCYSLEHLTGFHSGFKGSGDEKHEDFSILARINGRAMITPEGDVMMSNPNFPELMSQARRIFDGTSGATYKNSKEDKRYTGLRTPWIMAGTPALLDRNESRLGDRFLKIIMSQPDADERRQILRRAAYSEMRSVVRSSNHDPSSCVDPAMLEAYRLTGGYVDYLRANITDLLSALWIDEDALADRCGDLGELAAFLRARPNEDKTKLETHDTKELPTRLTKQLVRLAMVGAVVLNAKDVGDDVMRRVRKVAIDTASGTTFRMAAAMSANLLGLEDAEVASKANLQVERCRKLLYFMRSVGAAESRKQPKRPGHSSRDRWHLSGHLQEIWDRIVGEEKP